MYGLECEFELSSSEGLLNFYKLDNHSSEQWLSFTFAEKRERLDTTHKTVKSRTPWLTKFRDGQDLPDYLIKDDTGNLELVYEPVTSLDRLYCQIDFIKEWFGPDGMFQATVSLPTSYFFKNDFRDLYGWFQFFNELDFIEKLHFSHKKREKLIQGRKHWGFMEPFLGPLTEYKANRLRKALKYQSQGQWWDSENLNFLSHNASSSKYVGSTVYRPDIAGPERICLEIRDAHKNIGLLKSRLQRVQRFFPSSLQEFSRFYDCPHFSYSLDFEKFSPELQDQLMKRISHHVPPGLEKFSRVAEVYQVYRRLAYPLRDWNPWLTALDRESWEKPLLEAQERYHKQLTSIVRCDEPNSSALLLDALMAFVSESNLYHLFRDSPVVKPLSAPGVNSQLKQI